MHELVTEHVIRVGERTGHREHDAPFERLGHAAGAFADEALDGVGLAEVRGHRVQDDRLSPAELMAEEARETVVPPLGHPGRNRGGFGLLGVVVQVEVLSPQDLKVEGAVLDLVAAEVPDRRAVDGTLTSAIRSQPTRSCPRHRTFL